MNDHPTPVLKAREILNERWRRSRPPQISTPDWVILAYQPGLMRYAVRKYTTKRVGGFFGDVVLLKKFGTRVALCGNFGIGAPVTAIQVEEMAAFGVHRILSIGVAGSLQVGVSTGDWLVCESAVRDEGTSGHYMPAGLRVDADRGLAELLQRRLGGYGIPLHSGPIWTTDAPYRETSWDVATWQGEGVCAVDMEAAALFTVGQALGVQTGAAVVLADQISTRGWRPPDDPDMIEKRLQLLFEAVVDAVGTGTAGSG